MSTSRGRGKINTFELKKDEKQVWAGTKPSSSSLLTNSSSAKASSVSNLSNTESAMDEYLAKLNLYRKPVAKDGSCLFRVVSEQIYNTQAKHIQVRFECIDFMRKEKQLFEAFVEGSYEHHLYSLKNPKEWGGQVEISALSLLYQRDFIVYQSVNMEPQAVTCNNFDKKILLCYSNGNHYDAVYPLTFKANAAFAQALIYDMILDNTFQEIDSRQEIHENASNELNSTNDWTEVKNKQRDVKGKVVDEGGGDRVNTVFPEASKNQKICWQLKRSFDPTLYRNIELEVWEDFRADITKNDYALAASMQQLRPGEICLATIKEAKDVSEIIRVRIHEINPDKCTVYSEDEKTRYYVQLYDLQPIVGGDDTYKNLPGYYNKLDDRDAEFQHQKRRGKGGKKYRDDDTKRSDHQIRSGDISKRQESRGNGRRNPRNIDKKRDFIEKPANPGVRRVKSDQDIKRNERTEESNRNLVTSPDDPTKVAKPDESAATFWGRMRTSKTVGAGNISSPTSSKTPSPVEPPINSTETHPKVDSPLLQDAPLVLNTQTETSTKKLPSNSDKLQETTSSPIIKDSKKPAWGVIRTNVEPQISHLLKSNSENSSKPAKGPVTNLSDPICGSVSSSNTNYEKTNSVVNSIEISEEKTIEPSNSENITNSLLNNNINSPDSSSKKLNESPYNKEKQKQFNLTSQDSAKINEVRENILASSAKMTVMNSDNSDSTEIESESNTEEEIHVSSPSDHVTSNSFSTYDSTSVRNSHDTRDVKNDIVSTDDQVVDDSTSSHAKVSEAEKQADVKLNNISTTTSMTSTKSSDGITTTANSQNKMRLDITPSHSKLPNGDINDVTQFDHLTLEKHDDKQDRGKKRVSFGSTQIIDNQQHIVSHVPIDITTSMSSHTAPSEPGKIHLPPEHIEKHQNEFTSTIHTVDGLHSNTHAPHIVQSFIPSQTLPIYQPVQGFPTVFRMTYNNIPEQPTNNFITPVLSYDPDGKDLPDDVTVLRHFYNLGVQWYYALQNQPNNYHVNQPGILPAPVQHPIGNAPIRQILMASESPLLRSVDCYSPSSQQTIDTTAHLEQLNHLQQHVSGVGSTFLSANQRSGSTINSIPNLNQLTHQTGYEEYELPPRLQRGGITTNNRSNNTHRQFFNQRPFLSGGRGIIGQSPRHRYPIRTPQTPY